jgi:hypothetical protein
MINDRSLKIGWAPHILKRSGFPLLLFYVYDKLILQVQQIHFH